MQSSPRHTTEPAWHALQVESALERLSSSLAGLSSTEASTRLCEFGPNQLTATPAASAFKLLLDEFRSPLVIVLVAAAVVLVGVYQIAGDSGQLIDAGLIGLIVLLNASLGFTQNYRATRGIESLTRLAAPSATVLRDGVPEQVDDRERGERRSSTPQCGRGRRDGHQGHGRRARYVRHGAP